MTMRRSIDWRQIVRSRRFRRLAPGVVGGAYLLLVAFPGVLFAHRMDQGAFRVFSDRPIEPEMRGILEDAAGRLARSPLDDGSVDHRLYIANDGWRRTLLSPRSAGAFGSTYAFRWNSILNRVDIAAGVVQNDQPRYNRRSLAAVIAHERVHALLHNHFGHIATGLAPTWKVEGYCEYVAGEPSVDLEEGFRRVADGSIDVPGGPRYFRDQLMVRYLLDVEGMTVDELFDKSFGEEVVMGRVRAHLGELRDGMIAGSLELADGRQRGQTRPLSE